MSEYGRSSLLYVQEVFNHLYSKLLNIIDQGFLYTQYEGTALYIVCDTPTMYPNSHRNQQFSKQILTLYFVFFFNIDDIFFSFNLISL